MNCLIQLPWRIAYIKSSNNFAKVICLSSCFPSWTMMMTKKLPSRSYFLSWVKCSALFSACLLFVFIIYHIVFNESVFPIWCFWRQFTAAFSLLIFFLLPRDSSCNVNIQNFESALLGVRLVLWNVKRTTMKYSTFWIENSNFVGSVFLNYLAGMHDSGV